VRRGRVAPTLVGEPTEAERLVERAGRAGIDLDELGVRLEQEEITALQESFRSLLTRLRERRRTARAAAGHVRRPGGRGARVVVLRHLRLEGSGTAADR
jgi:hypothetical protein